MENTERIEEVNVQETAKIYDFEAPVVEQTEEHESNNLGAYVVGAAIVVAGAAVYKGVKWVVAKVKTARDEKREYVYVEPEELREVPSDEEK